MSLPIKPTRGTPLKRGHILSRGLKMALLFSAGMGGNIKDYQNIQRVVPFPVADSDAWWIPSGIKVLDNYRIPFMNPSPNTDLLASDAFTIVYRGIPTSNAENYVCGWNSGTRYPAWGIPLNTASKQPILFMGDNNKRIWSGSNPINIFDGSAHTMAVNIPGAAQTDVASSKMFIDGVKQASVSTVTTDTQNARNAFRLAETANNARRFAGTYELFYYYDRALSDEEMAWITSDYYVIWNRPEDIFAMMLAAAVGGETVLISKASLTSIGRAVNPNAETVLGIAKGSLTSTGIAFNVNQAMVIQLARATMSHLGKAISVNDNVVIAKGALTATGRTVQSNMETYIQIAKAGFVATGKALKANVTIHIAKAAMGMVGRAVKVAGEVVRRRSTWLLYEALRKKE